MSCRLAIVSSHPIQYNAPAFAALASDPALEVHVFYSWEGPSRSVDPEFGHVVEWDIPLLDGYDHTFVRNKSKDPGTHHFRGLDNPEMVEQIREWNPDALLIYGWSFLTHLRVMRAFKGKVPILFRGDSTLLGDRSAVTKFARRRFLRWVFRHVDIALYVGKHNRDYYIEMGMSESQLIWAPHAIDRERFTRDELEDESRAGEWRRQLGINDDDVAFVFAGKLIPRKDPWTLLNAFLELRSNGGAHLIFVGEGELRSELENASRGRTNIHFVGFQNQSAMSRVYRLGNVLVLPSLIDTWGLAVNEAMTCSRAAIVSDLAGCAPDLVLNGKTGGVFAHKDVKALAGLLSQVCNDRESWRQMGIAARDLIEHWSIPIYAGIVREAVMSA